MTSDRWQTVKDLMDAALRVSLSERAEFVGEQAREDEELRAEVMSLLASHEDAGDFLESPPVRITAPEQVVETEASLAGEQVGAYRLIREIGRGGMGTVYLGIRAEDESGQPVAVKLIREGMESDFAIRRFRNEREILARLEHPNIARLLDGGATTQGFPYFVMEYVEGQPLLTHCQSRSLGLRERIGIFLQVCAAVHYAHRRMIIHRDLKPSNILVTADGTPKLLDFGIAKMLVPEPATGDEKTLTQMRLITPAYASPEQFRGEPVTVRSDLYSLGLVLWELILGRSSRRSDGIRSFELPEDTNEFSRQLLRNVRNAVLKAVRTDPRERYESVEAFAADLEIVRAGGEVPEYGPAEQHSRGPEVPQPNSIAVLPFQVLAMDHTSENYLGVGITDALITRLSNVGRIAVRPTGAVMRFSSTASALDAGRQLNVQYVLEGRIQKAKERMRVTVQLVDVQAQTPVWADHFDEQFEDLLKVEDSIAARVAQALIPQMTGEEKSELARRGTANPKAHEAYLRGRWYWSRFTEEALPHALVQFTEAVAVDPGYARAHAGIADYHIALGIWGLLPPMESFAAAIDSARTAIRLDGKLAEAHASLGLALWMHDGDFETATHHLQMAMALNPESAAAHDWFGLINSARGKAEMAIASLERARKLEPHGAMFWADLAFCHYNARQFEEAIASFYGPRQAGDALPDPAPVVNGAVLPLSLLAIGDVARAVAAARRLVEVSGRNTLALGAMAHAVSAAGEPDEARALLQELTTRARDYYVPGVALALANLACGRTTEAIRNLERACHDGDLWTMYLALMPVWDPLRQHQRFQRLLKSKAYPARGALWTGVGQAARKASRRVTGR
ncbi:MAG TPA: protein kinase [Bryobacteraceae bacterium]|nr:protein kinase [Bryobacteraceae bacterium]